MQLLTFELNGICFGIPLVDVESIETKSRVVEVPDSPPHVRGIMKLHGEIIPIYSLTDRFGYQEQKISNIIVANANGIKIGLEVQDVNEIIEVDNTSVTPMPELMNARQNCFNEVAYRGKELIVVLSTSNLISLAEQQEIKKMLEDRSKQ